MQECPKCHRKLLSQASARCNWCGELIEDAAYQQQAQTEREAFFEHSAERDAMAISRVEAIQVVNPMQRMLGPLRPSLWRKPIPPDVGRMTGKVDPTTGIPDIPMSALAGVPEAFSSPAPNTPARAPLASGWPDPTTMQGTQPPQPPAQEQPGQPWYTSSGPDAAPLQPLNQTSAPMPEWPQYANSTYDSFNKSVEQMKQTPPKTEDGKEPTGRFDHLEIDPQ